LEPQLPLDGMRAVVALEREAVFCAASGFWISFHCRCESFGTSVSADGG